MERSLKLIAIVFLLCIFSPVSHAQVSSPDDGGVVNGVYTNRYFGFSLSYPKDWVVHGEATNTRLRELGKERAASSGAMSAASTEVILRNTYQLLTTFQYPMGAAIAVNPAFMVVAEKVDHAPGIVTGRDYLLHVRPLMIKTGLIPINDEPIELTLAGRKFYRQDSRMDLAGVAVEQSIIITVTRGFALAFILSGKDQASISELTRAVATLKFSEPPSVLPKKPVPTTKPKPRPRS